MLVLGDRSSHPTPDIRARCSGVPLSYLMDSTIYLGDEVCQQMQLIKKDRVGLAKLPGSEAWVKRIVREIREGRNLSGVNVKSSSPMSWCGFDGSTPYCGNQPPGLSVFIRLGATAHTTSFLEPILKRTSGDPHVRTFDEFLMMEAT